MRKVQEEKGIVVKTLEDEPVLARHLYWIWQGFSDLNSRRPIGMSGPLPFTYSDIEAYCRLKGMNLPGERERLLRFIEILDREWLADWIAKQNRTSPDSPPAPPSRPNHGRRAPRKAS